MISHLHNRNDELPQLNKINNQIEKWAKIYEKKCIEKKYD